MCTLFLVNGKTDFELSVGSTCGSVLSWVLRKNVWDEVTKSFGVLLRVDCGDFSTSLQQRKETRSKSLKKKFYIVYLTIWHESQALAGTTSMCFWTADSSPPSISFLSYATHPVLDSFCCMSGFLLGVVLSKYVNEAHEIDLSLRGS